MLYCSCCWYFCLQTGDEMVPLQMLISKFQTIYTLSAKRQAFSRCWWIGLFRCRMGTALLLMRCLLLCTAAAAAALQLSPDQLHAAVAAASAHVSAFGAAAASAAGFGGWSDHKGSYIVHWTTLLTAQTHEYCSLLNRTALRFTGPRYKTLFGAGPDLGWWGPWGKAIGGGPMHQGSIYSQTKLQEDATSPPLPLPKTGSGGITTGKIVGFCIGMPLLAQFSLARFSGARIWSTPRITANS